MDRNDQVLTATLFALIAAIAILAIFNSHDHGNAAEWAGAIFTAAAVFGAIWTAGQAMRLERDRTLARARVFAFYVAPIVIRIDNAADRALEYGAESNFGFEDAHLQNFDIEVMKKLNIAADIPRDLFGDSWALAPELARDCIRLDAFVRQYRGIVEGKIPCLRLMTHQEREKYLETIALSLKPVKGLSSQARSALVALNGDLPG